MKIIEAMKQIKDLQVKKDDLVQKVQKHCADLDYETPVYPEQKDQVQKWIQAHSDILKEILNLRFQIQRTNIATTVPIELGGAKVTKSIAEWIHRRRDLANHEMTIWMSLTDRNLKEGLLPSSNPQEQRREVKIRRYYDPVQRDKSIDLYRSEPGIIDRTLEVVNATTDLIE